MEVHVGSHACMAKSYGKFDITSLQWKVQSNVPEVTFCNMKQAHWEPMDDGLDWDNLYANMGNA